MSINKVIVTGNLTRDAELRSTPSGAQLLQHCQFHVVSKGWGMGGV